MRKILSGIARTKKEVIPVRDRRQDQDAEKIVQRFDETPPAAEH